MVIYPTFDFTTFQGIDYSGNAGKELVTLFFILKAVIYFFTEGLKHFFEHFTGAGCYLITKENPYFVQFLPLAIKQQQASNLKIAGSNIKPAGDRQRTIKEFFYACFFALIINYINGHRYSRLYIFYHGLS